MDSAPKLQKERSPADISIRGLLKLILDFQSPEM